MTDYDKLVSETETRSKFFQTIQSLPLDEEFNYKGWLKNFTGADDKILACHILDFFTFYSSKMINKMLEVSIGYSGYSLRQKFPMWQHADFKEKCLYSYIVGE